MKGAIFFSSKYGSTAQYAKWIADATNLPLFDVKKVAVDPSEYDFLVLGSPIIYHKLMFHKWLTKHSTTITGKPTILFSVSGAPSGGKLNGWVANSASPELIDHMYHVVLLGRQNPKDLNLFDRIALIIGGMGNPDPVAAREEREGFDYMDQSSIAPIVDWIERIRNEHSKQSANPKRVEINSSRV